MTHLLMPHFFLAKEEAYTNEYGYMLWQIGLSMIFPGSLFHIEMDTVLIDWQRFCALLEHAESFGS